MIKNGRDERIRTSDPMLPKHNMGWLMDMKSNNLAMLPSSRSDENGRKSMKVAPKTAPGFYARAAFPHPTLFHLIFIYLYIH